MATNSNRSAGTQKTQRGIVQGNILVDPVTGLPVDVIEDTAGKRRLAVDAEFVADNLNIDVELDFENDSVTVGDAASGNTLSIEADGSLNVNTATDAKSGDNISISAHPIQIFEENSDTLTTATFTEIFTFTASDNDTKISALHCTVSTPARFRVLINNEVKYEKWSSPIERNVVFEFKEHRSLASSDTISVEARVERLIKSTYDTFVTLEGYIA
jgi:hypothetical protein